MFVCVCCVVVFVCCLFVVCLVLCLLFYTKTENTNNKQHGLCICKVVFFYASDMVGFNQTLCGPAHKQMKSDIELKSNIS